MSHKLALDEIVTFVGDVADDVLPQYYAACDALVLPSRDMSEGFGLTLLEANATGKPVIASNVGGIPYVVKNGYNGILVPPNDAIALSRAILSFVKDLEKTREMGFNGRRVAEDHDWTITAAKTEQVYSESASDHQESS
jgi:D-inositol-3-phosphate glycosyltransferase